MRCATRRSWPGSKKSSHSVGAGDRFDGTDLGRSMLRTGGFDKDSGVVDMVDRDPDD
jgi:hypothetical protein